MGEVIAYAAFTDVNLGDSPALVSYGSPMGLDHIQGEASTKDGLVLNPLTQEIPSILGEGSVIRAVDGLQFSGRDSLFVIVLKIFPAGLMKDKQSGVPFRRYHGCGCTLKQWFFIRPERGI